jgi:rhomboid family protein
MKRYAILAARFALVPIISGPFVVSATGRASAIEWAHIITGYATIYLIVGLVIVSAGHPQLRLPALVALAVGLLEALPNMPQLHAAVSPILFATLTWAVLAQPAREETARGKSRRIFVLPAMVLLPLYYGVGYRHQTSSFVPHIGAALPVAGVLVGFCMFMNERHPENKTLRRACNLTMTAVLVQVVFGIVAFIIRLLGIQGGLLLAYSRTAHITGAALVLSATTELAIQYRRTVIR